MNRYGHRLLSAAAVSALAAGATLITWNSALRADDKPSTPSIKEIMDVLHKGDKPLAKTILGGKATHEDADQALSLYKALAADKPEKGDEADWKKRTEALLAAAEELDKGDKPSPEAIKTYKTALDCKGCHTEHRVKKK